jgi:hypothetical protein
MTTTKTIKITLRNPLQHDDKISYYINTLDNQLSRDWVVALKSLLHSSLLIEKNFCFVGFPNTARNLELLCKELNSAIYTINNFNSNLGWVKEGLESYVIEDYFVPDAVRFGTEYSVSNRFHKENSEDTVYIENLGLLQKHEILNRLHNHFENLQGTVDNLSPYYICANYETKFAIRQLNVLCHEIETLIISQQKQAYIPEWSRPSQITTWLHAPRYNLTEEHRQLFSQNGYDRKFGYVYMHWAQIGKTLFEVFRDEDAPMLTDTICDAITELKYYSGEFDIEWGADVIYGDSKTFWHTKQQDEFKKWLLENNKNPNDVNLSLGYLPIGYVDLEKSFGTNDIFEIWDKLSTHLDIFSIEIDDIKKTYDYCWSDKNYKQMQIDIMRPGYDFNSRR